MAETNTVSFQTPPTTVEPPAPETPATPADRPAWLPEQFKSVEDYAKALGDTKAELTRTQQELSKLKKPADGQPQEGAPKADEKPVDPLTIKDEPKEGEDKAVDDAAKAAGVDLEPYRNEFLTTGDVAEENRVAIADKLKSILGEEARVYVDEYIEGKKAAAHNARSQIVGVAGGEEGYASLVQWAAKNLPEQERAVYNAQVTSGDFHTTMFAVQALKARYEAVNGKAPKLISGDGPAANEGGFKSLHEMKQAIADPRYHTDPDYRASVAKRLAKSNI